MIFILDICHVLISLLRNILKCILEFDTVADIKRFDNKFVQNMGENILTNICDVLDCSDEEILHIHQIKRGQTNISL